jgi:hypothetical protein
MHDECMDRHESFMGRGFKGLLKECRVSCFDIEEQQSSKWIGASLLVKNTNKGEKVKIDLREIVGEEHRQGR